MVLRSAALAACMLIVAGFGSNASAKLIVSELAPVNVTPHEFSIQGHVDGLASARLEVFADAQGTSSLAGVVGIESYPVHTGDPALQTAYERRMQKAALRAKTREHELVFWRVTQCEAGTSYFYRLSITDTNGEEIIWPTNGVLPEVSTAIGNSFVPQAKQLVIELPGTTNEGRVVTLSHPSAAYKLAGVVGDGAKSNQVVFSLSDLLSETNGSNLALVGQQQFTAEIVGQCKMGASRYTLNFPEGFGMGGGPSPEQWDMLFLGIGSAVLRVGQSDSVTINLASQSGLASVSFSLDLPAGRLGNLMLQPIAPQLESFSLQAGAGGRSLLIFAFRPGQLLSGTQELARISFTALEQTSAILPLQAMDFSAIKPDSSSVANTSFKDGEVVVVAGNPLVGIQASTNRTRTLNVIGVPGMSYQMQYSLNLSDPNGWKDWVTVPLTGFSASVDALETTNHTIFFRAREIKP